MFGLSRGATTLWLTVNATGAVVIGASVWLASGDLRSAPAALLFGVACAIAETFKVELPTSRPNDRMVISIGAAGSIAAVLLFPVHWAVIAVALGIAFGNRTIWFKRAYNISQIGIAAAAGS